MTTVSFITPETGEESKMSKMADASGSRRARPDSELEKKASSGSGFAPVPAPRAAPLAPELNLPGLPAAGGETTQYQVPLELLVLARNKEKDKARSVAVTPVAPRPKSDEPPPSSELSSLKVEQPPELALLSPALLRASGAPPLPAPPAVPALSLMESPLPAASEAAPADSEHARGKAGSRVAWLLLAALWAGVAYFALQLLRMP